MGMCCILTCDEKIDGAWPDDVLTPICHDSGREPMGRTPQEARAIARQWGWKIGRRDICPGCQEAKAKGIEGFLT